VSTEWEWEEFEKEVAKGREMGRLESLQKIRNTLALHLEKRFGPLPLSAQERLQEIDSVEQLVGLVFRIPQAGSLDALGLS
jgi:flagellar biosynthesis/type III secretory pathway protein FliH